MAVTPAADRSAEAPMPVMPAEPETVLLEDAPTPAGREASGCGGRGAVPGEAG